MIPLLMEKMAWPPKGGMGPIFGEYLFVRFYRRDGEGSVGDDDGLFWPPMMFNQLIMQIRYSVAPFQELIPEGSKFKDIDKALRECFRTEMAEFIFYFRFALQELVESSRRGHRDQEERTSKGQGRVKGQQRSAIGERFKRGQKRGYLLYIVNT